MGALGVAVIGAPLMGDDIAADNTAQIADLIANNLGWKLVLPHVEPEQPDAAQ